MRTALALLLVLAGVAGCASPEAPSGGAGSAEEGEGEDGFRVPALGAGDRLRYGFGFKGATFSATGITDLVVVGLESHPDGFGVQRPALHVRQASPGGGFGEDYWADPETLEQFHIQRPASSNHVSRFPSDPITALPAKHAMYGNGTGTLDRYNEDPVFEDLSFFGSFASGTTIPDEGPYAVEGDLWLRETTFRLAEGPFNATVKSSENSTWGPLRTLEATAAKKLSDDIQESIHWVGSFSTRVPLAVEIVRHIEYRIHSDPVKLTFNASLLEYTQGGERIPRGNGTDGPESRPGVERAAWQNAPPDGSGAKLGFPLSEALTALALDPTAKQYFADHAGSYLARADLEEADTCGFYGGHQGNQVPGCHWWTWEGRFQAPDDYRLDFVVEKYADASGSGVAYVPLVTRDQVFETLFGLPGAPAVPPEAPVRVSKASTDLPARSAYGPDTITIAGALAVFASQGTPTTSGLPANGMFLVLGKNGYGFEISRHDWYFPQNPELLPFYDQGPLILERHRLDLRSDGWVRENRNLDYKVEQR